jgi:hypothetical protein
VRLLSGCAFGSDIIAWLETRRDIRSEKRGVNRGYMI